jgi:hypothetical protein
VPTRAAKAEQKSLVPARQAQHKLSVNGSVFQLKEAGGGREMSGWEFNYVYVRVNSVHY